MVWGRRGYDGGGERLGERRGVSGGIVEKGESAGGQSGAGWGG